MSSSEQPDDDLIPAAEVARRYGIHEKTVHAWAKSGRIPAPAIDRRGERGGTPYKRWSRIEVSAHIESIKRGELAEAAS